MHLTAYCVEAAEMVTARSRRPAGFLLRRCLDANVRGSQRSVTHATVSETLVQGGRQS